MLSGRRQYLDAMLVTALIGVVAMAAPDVSAASGPPLVGGWNLDRPSAVAEAAAGGVNASFSYVHDPPTSRVGRALRSMGVSEIDGALLDLLMRYECHKLNPPGAPSQMDCSGEPDYSQMTLEGFSAGVAMHLQSVALQMQSDPAFRVGGYWILDDWPDNIDPGGAIQALERAHDLIAQYTPNVPTFCGFGASLGVPGNPDLWTPPTAANFTSAGCDRVTVYIYSRQLPVSSATLAPGQIDWSMGTLLPTVLNDLKAHGWTPSQTPLVGIAQAFGGTTLADSTFQYATPAMGDIATQAKAFCSAGAIGIAFYAWHLSGFGTDAQSPAINSSLEAGVRKGISACAAQWGTGAGLPNTSAAAPSSPRAGGPIAPEDQALVDPISAATAAAPSVVQTWGDNTHGQLGDGTVIPHSAPAAAGSSAFNAVAAGGRHALALAADGTVWAWGNNRSGQLGIPTTDLCSSEPCMTTPTAVPGIDDVSAVAAGQAYSLALKKDGSVWAWGSDGAGQLGRWLTTSCQGIPCSPTPVQVPGLDNIVAIATNYQHSLALRADRTVWAWGLDDLGELGASPVDTCGGTACTVQPTPVPGLPRIVAIAAGSFHSLAVGADGSLWAWGLNDRGQLGVASSDTCSNMPCSRVPVQVSGVNAVRGASAGGYYSLALGSDGQVWSFGDDLYGQLGTPASSTCYGDPCTPAPTQIASLPPATEIAAGESHAMALDANSTVWTWGLDDVNELAVPGGATCAGYACVVTPVQIPTLAGVTSIAASADSTFAVAIGAPVGQAAAH